MEKNLKSFKGEIDARCQFSSIKEKYGVGLQKAKQKHRHEAATSSLRNTGSLTINDLIKGS